jgi:hypothetical protein
MSLEAVLEALKAILEWENIKKTTLRNAKVESVYMRRMQEMLFGVRSTIAHRQVNAERFGFPKQCAWIDA